MKRIDTADAQADKHGTGKDGFTDGEPGVTPPTMADADYFDGVQEEIVNVIEASGRTPSGDLLNQMLSALRQWFAGLSYRNHTTVDVADLDTAQAAYGSGDTWFIGCGDGDVGYSDNGGYDWTAVEDSTTDDVYGLAKYSSTLIAVGGNAMFARSSFVTPPSWTYSTPASYAGTLRSVAVGTTHVVAVGTAAGIQRAAVGSLGTLTKPTADASYAGDFSHVLYDEENERFVAFGEDGEVQVSDDEGATWSQTLAAGLGDWMKAATDGQGTIVVGGTGGDFKYSDDCGDSWNECALNVENVGGIIFDGAHFVVAHLDSGDQVNLMWSSDPSFAAINRETVQVTDGGTAAVGALAVNDKGSVIAVRGGAEVFRFLARSGPF